MSSGAQLKTAVLEKYAINSSGMDSKRAQGIAEHGTAHRARVRDRRADALTPNFLKVPRMQALGSQFSFAPIAAARSLELHDSDIQRRRCVYIVPSSAGSAVDTIGRIVAAGLTDVLGQQVVVEDRPGAGGNIGAGVAAKAIADGYTVLQVNNNHTTNVTLYKNLTYDLLRDFAPVTQLASSPYVIVVHPSLPARSISGYQACQSPACSHSVCLGRGRQRHVHGHRTVKEPGAPRYAARSRTTAVVLL